MNTNKTSTTDNNNIRYILASASPRRRELIKLLGIDVEIIPSDFDEEITDVEPSKIVENLSYGKAKSVFDVIISDSDSKDSTDTIIVIGADTIVFYNGEILGKPADTNEARDMISLLSDRTHQVYTGVTLIKHENGKTTSKSFSEKTDVIVDKLDRFEIEDYIKTGDSLDKAGAYGIQGIFAKHIKGIIGDYNNVVGLPVARLYSEIKTL